MSGKFGEMRLGRENDGCVMPDVVPLTKLEQRLWAMFFRFSVRQRMRSNTVQSSAAIIRVSAQDSDQFIYEMRKRCT